jgi:riboflavin kinase/FMN adenylyltransferase
MDMYMRVINWEEYVGSREPGVGSRNRCLDNDRVPDTDAPHCSLLIAHCSLAVTVGVFDGVHLGHQSLIRRICEPLPEPRTPNPEPSLPTVVTFRENPMKSLNSAGFTGDIYNLDQKLGLLESLGVKLTVLIDFSEEISKMNGRDFIDLLLGSQPVTLLALGGNFRCGHDQDTGVGEIRSFAKAHGVETWVAPPVMDEGKPISSNRIRQALAAGRLEEAQRMLGRPLDSITFNKFVPK